MTNHRCHFLLVILAFLALAALYLPTLAPPARALDDGLARTPPMGWNSWNHFGCEIDEGIIRGMADALVASGMREAGYNYVVVDDCWQSGRDAHGQIMADPHRFPSGIAALAEYIHNHGLRFGLYTDVGTQTCMGRPGSLGHEFQDAATYAAWGVDYVKIDWCYSAGLDAAAQYGLWRDALFATGRPIVLSICTWGVASPWDWGPTTGHLWRTTRDIADRWPVVLQIIRENAVRAYAAGPGGWNDPDMLEVGNGRMTDAEYRTHFGLWAMMAAPLIAGNDLSRMTDATRAILLNQEIIAVDQDPLGVPALIIRDDGGPQVWSRPLADGSRAVALFNPTDWSNTVAVSWQEIGLAPGAATVRDLWAHTDLGAFTDRFSATVEPHATAMLIIRSTPIDEGSSGDQGGDQQVIDGGSIDPLTPAPDWLQYDGVYFASDMPWSAEINAFGPAERDRSNGEDASGDGATLTIAGVPYDKGIGVHSPAEIGITVGGKCTVFAAEVGIDDEVGDQGAAIYQVWGDGALLYETGVLTGANGAESIYQDITGVHELHLVVAAAGDTAYAHADWANARLACNR